MKKSKKQRLPRKLKKEAKKLRAIGMMQISLGTRKGFKMNKWTWKLYFRASAFYYHCFIETFAEVDKHAKNVYYTLPDYQGVDIPGYGYTPDNKRLGVI